MITLVKERALTHFAELVSVYSRSLRRAWIISPWITATDNFYALNLVVGTLEQSRASLTVVTRAAEKVNHQAALRTVMSLAQAEVYVLPHLHAKLYMLECEGFRAALLGSANFTEEGDQQLVEIVADVRSSRESDPAARFIADLFGFAVDLTCHPSATCSKALADGWWRRG
jgi:hypothetical protein